MKQSIIAIVAGVVLAGGALAAQQAPPTTAKPEAPKAAPSFAGKWAGSVETPQGGMPLALDVKIDAANKVTGTLEGNAGPSPIKGEVKEGTLTFSFGFDAGGTAIEIYFEGKMKEDGKLAGTMSAGDMGTFPFTAERAKGL